MYSHSLITRTSILLTALVLFFANFASAETQYLSDDPTKRYSTVPHNPEVEAAIEESDLDRIAVRHLGWDETIRSWARIKLNEMTSKNSIRGQNPIYTVLSLMYEQEKWYEADIFPLEHPEVGKLLGLKGKWISAKDFLENEKLDAFQDALDEMQARKEELDEKVELLNAIEQASYYDMHETGIIDSFTPDFMTSDEFHNLLHNDLEIESIKEDYEELRKTVKEENALRKAGQSLIRRWQTASHLRDEFLIIPDLESLDESWIAANKSRPSGTGVANKPEIIQINNSVLRERSFNLKNAAYAFDQRLVQAFSQQSPAVITDAAEEFLRTVEKLDAYPTSDYRSLLNSYINLNPMRKAAYIYGLSILLFGLFAFFKKPVLMWTGVGFLILGFGFHTFGGVARLMLTGHIPVSNMYESITFTAWCAALIGISLELWKRKGFFGLGTAIVVFLMMMGVSLMPLHETRLHPLRAVLNSYWLNIHVTAMLVSYGAFMVSTFYAISYLIKAGLMKKFGRETFLNGSEPMMNMEITEQFMYRLIQIGWPILTVGICLGAVWADTAWGRYWGWDPKETWALITWMIYTIYLHSRMVMSWKGVGSAIFAVLGFVMVMITWLGVSYLPWFAGGLHTYASPN